MASTVFFLGIILLPSLLGILLKLDTDMKKYFMELSKEVDMDADYAHGAGRILTFHP